jgi:hypothetical protein
MKHMLTIAIAALLLAAASAAALPENATVTVIGEAGVEVGTGVIVDGILSVSLDAEASGYVTVRIETDDGLVLEVDGVIDAEGELQLLIEAEPIDPGDIELIVDLPEPTPIGGIGRGVEDIESLPQPAQDGMARAAENRAAAREKAAEARTRGRGHEGADGHPGLGAERRAGGRVDAEAGVGLRIGIGAAE